MSSVIVDIEGVPELQLHLRQVVDALNSIQEGLVYAVDTVLLPDVLSRATFWGTRTGSYSTGWYRAPISDDAVEVGNTAKQALPLETGWITRAGTFVESPGVLYPALESSAPAMLEAISKWLKFKASL